jgi:hypothetical protein
MKKEEKEEKIEYKNKVVFLRKSKAGEHLYAFDYNGAFADAKEGSIIMNISDVKALIAGKWDKIKVSIMPKKDEIAEVNNAAKS